MLTDLEVSDSDFTIDQGTWDSSDNSQVSELVVEAATMDTFTVNGELNVTCVIDGSLFSGELNIDLFVPGK